ncbi:UNVERIFIED_CONTAM: hypothetical protein PYX00_005422 [Menopon gallinae]|uniref:CAF1B/HIR1 beta-propeller domain-containing protein n=1 Tax=Menopon gallinae TaxID=328185 RepID=A0AAW2HR42_9NEOP
MKCVVPEISWHNRDPVYTIDIQPKTNQVEKFYRLASGGADSHVVIWYLTLPEENDKEPAVVEFAADLDRHVKAVNVVRFSKDGECLASGGDDAVIIIWKLKKEPSLIDSPSSKDEKDKETWISWKVLKGHLEDVYDLSWSSDGTKLISGSVDNTAIIWDVTKGRSLGIVGEHKGFVQGVAWDPKDKYLATMCTDRTLRIINRHTKRTVSKITKAKCPNNKSDQKSEDKFTKLFHDDTLKTFSDDYDGKSIDVSYVFTRNSLNQPLLHLPSPGAVFSSCEMLPYCVSIEGLCR